MRLYHHPISLNARRAVMTALQLDAAVELVFVDLRAQENLKPQFLQMNPNHRVPVLVDGDFQLWESRAIMQYLADKTPRQTIYPTDVRARADVNRWLFWCSQHFTPAIGILNWENFIKPMIGRGDPDPLEVKRGETLVAEFATVLDAHLAPREWICGSALTLADLSIAAALGCAVAAKAPVAQYANLQKWFGSVQRLEAWKKTETGAAV
jgi:glutathione S-transferase